MIPNLTESHRRLCEKLHRDLGNTIIGYLEDNDVNEIMLNPDGSLWIDRTSNGQQCVGMMTSGQSYSVMNTVAGIHGFVVSQHSPILEAELPYFSAMKGERFTGQVPPIVSSPCFTIRKKSEKVFCFEDYVATHRMTENQAKVLRTCVANRKNILVCGGPGSGKTTVTNAMIVEAVNIDPMQRFLLLEDLPELQCTATNKVGMLTSHAVTMTLLLKEAMRMRPDRILIGEVRGAEALDMLKAWNTGCPGGICTVHANGAEEAIQRILSLAMEAGLSVPPIQLVLQTIDVIVSVVRKDNKKGFINEILSVGDYQHETFSFNTLA